jgi:hypothetical protein
VQTRVRQARPGALEVLAESHGCARDDLVAPAGDGATEPTRLDGHLDVAEVTHDLTGAGTASAVSVWL